MTDAERIERLERAVDELRQELRRELTALRAERVERGERGERVDAPPRPTPAGTPIGAAPGAPRASRPPAPGPLDALTARLGVPAVPTDREGIEAIVGRYGTVALAALLILMGVGAFLTWAIANVTIGPTTRVVLGALAAALLGGAGWRLRARGDAGGSRPFGNVLLALALAVVHVDAWGAGPNLGLVAPAAALAIAAVASAAIALLAWRHREQPLFVVGVGGALVAPFVAGAAEGDALVLAAYGWLVLASGMLALPRSAPDDAPPRRWGVAARLLGLGGAGYTAALVDAVVGAETGVGRGVLAALGALPLRRGVPALFPLACAAVALLLGHGTRGGAAYGGGLALAFLTSALGALLALALDTGTGAVPLAVAALGATAGVYAALPLLPRDDRPGIGLLRSASVRPPFSALVLPLGFLAAALVALPEPVTAAGATAAAAWAALAAAAAWVARPAPRPDTTAVGDAGDAGAAATSGGARGPLFGAHVAVAGLASALAPVLLIGPHPVARALALAAHAALAALVATRVRERLALLPPLAALTVASATVAAVLEGRAHFAYTPFATRESLAAAAVVGAWVVLAWTAWRDRPRRARPDRDAPVTAGERVALVAAAPTAALLWGREELAHAVSPDVATFLLVGYFAAAGIAAITVGRARRVAGARQAGLALALYAAVKALAQASALDPVGLRVGSYLVVGGFLLGVGYFYRSA